MDWCRLWHGMPNDPKFGLVAKKAGDVPAGLVIAVFVRMMDRASQATERGRIEGWDDEEEAHALGFDQRTVESIRSAMQGKLLEGDRLTGWDKRQPKRERPNDVSTERTKAFRARRVDETPRNATERHGTPRLDKSRVDKKTNTPPCVPPQGGKPAKGQRLPENWEVGPNERAFAVEMGLSDAQIAFEAAKFRDHWHASSAKNAVKRDWLAAWRNWLRSDYRSTGPPRLAVSNNADDQRQQQYARIAKGLGLPEMDHVASKAS